jgi:hypothetical protein
MTARERGDHHQLDRFVVTDDRFRHLAARAREELAEPFSGVVLADFAVRFVDHVCHWEPPVS